MPQVWCIKLLGSAVLYRMRRTSDYFMSVLRYVSVLIVWILPKLRCASGNGHETAGKTAQADIRLGNIWGNAFCTWSALHNRWPCINYFEAGSRAKHFLAHKVDCSRWGGFDDRFASDVQALK